MIIKLKVYGAVWIFKMANDCAGRSREIVVRCRVFVSIVFINDVFYGGRRIESFVDGTKLGLSLSYK